MIDSWLIFNAERMHYEPEPHNSLSRDRAWHGRCIRVDRDFDAEALGRALDVPNRRRAISISSGVRVWLAAHGHA
jgi:hypothetical protein